jgi:hypothetical protein
VADVMRPLSVLGVGGRSIGRWGVVGVVLMAAWFFPTAASAQPVTSVINGNEAPQGAFPFMAFVFFENATEAFVCSGTLVSSNVVLTAGHCSEETETGVIHAPQNFRVVTGSSNWAAPPRVVSAVTRVAIYPGFLRTSLQGDAALLQLAAPVASPPVPLATTRPAAGTEGIIVGWGNKSFGQEAVSESLAYGSTVVQAPAYCQQEWGSAFHSASQLCAVDYPSYTYGTCHGDSGGPMLQTVGSGFVEIGITSFGAGECQTSVPEVDTRADFVQPWVSQEITAFAPPPPPVPVVPASPSPAPTAPTPTPTSTPTLPTLDADAARQDLNSTLSKRLGYRYKRRIAYGVTCGEESSTEQRCFMHWRALAFSYSGSATVYYYLEGSTVETAVRYTIKRIPTRCRHGCRPTIFHG